MVHLFGIESVVCTPSHRIRWNILAFEKDYELNDYETSNCEEGIVVFKKRAYHMNIDIPFADFPWRQGYIGSWALPESSVSGTYSVTLTSFWSLKIWYEDVFLEELFFNSTPFFHLGFCQFLHLLLRRLKPTCKVHKFGEKPYLRLQTAFNRVEYWILFRIEGLVILGGYIIESEAEPFLGIFLFIYLS